MNASVPVARQEPVAPDTPTGRYSGPESQGTHNSIGKVATDPLQQFNRKFDIRTPPLPSYGVL